MSRHYLARLANRPFIDPRAIITHRGLSLGAGAFVADRVAIHQARDGGAVSIGDATVLMRDGVLETGDGGSVAVGANSFLHPRFQVMAYRGDVIIGSHCTIAPGCAFYAYNHSFAAGEHIKYQPIFSKGGIRLGDGVWLGTGVIVLDGVTIGEGAVVGAGAVVTSDVPPNCIAAGSPASVIKSRDAVQP